MNVIYDKKTDALYIDLSSGTYDKSRKITDRIIVDETKTGKVLGIEILDATKTIQQFDPGKLILTQRAQENNQFPRHHA